MSEAKSLIIDFSGGQSLFDKDGLSIDYPVPYKGWMDLLFDDLQSRGIDVLSLKITMGGHGTLIDVKPFRTEEGGWNYHLRHLK